MSCSDCGVSPVNHSVEKFSALLSDIERPFVYVARRLSSYSAPVYTRCAPSLFKFLARTRLGTIVHEPDEQTGRRARAIWNEAKHRGIDMWEFRLFGVSNEIFVATITKKQKNTKTNFNKDDATKNVTKTTIIFEGLPRPRGHLPASVDWIDDKDIARKRLIHAGIPMARGGSAISWRKTKKMFNDIRRNVPNSPVIIKPSIGSRSRHTTVHINNIEDLLKAYVVAKQLSHRIIIEQELQGMVYRGTVIGGKVIGIRRKDPPHVIGDGIHSVTQLIATENTRPERQGPIYTKIPTAELVGKILETIPRSGEVITLSDKTVIALGGGSTDVTDIAHPDIIALLERLAVVLKDSLVGADFIVADITRPLADPVNIHSGIIECNSLPFIDVHLYPLHGKARNTTGALWDIVISSIF